MTAIQLNAEIYEALSIIAKDESLLRKAAKALKKLASQKSDETLMTENDFFVRIDEACVLYSYGSVVLRCPDGLYIDG